LASFSSLQVLRCGSGQYLCSAAGSVGWSPFQPGHTLVTSGVYGVIRHPTEGDPFFT
jgi:protein-S-isoprenylcysteine O-methyltransferase Ste14